MIPRRIFQFVHDERSIPEQCRSCMDGVRCFAADYGYEYSLLTLNDLASIGLCVQDARARRLLNRCLNLGDLGDIVRLMLLAEKGGWWFDWDLQVMNPATLDRCLREHSDFHWTGIIDHENNVVATEFQGGTPGNFISRGFLDWLARSDTENATPGGQLAGPYSLTGFLRQTQLVDHRVRLIPVRHCFQATYSEVKEKGIGPSTVDPRPLFHHWVHVWIGHPFDMRAWFRTLSTQVDPAVTVLMPVYNAGAYLTAAIESILCQTHRDFEFLIIDDG